MTLKNNLNGIIIYSYCMIRCMDVNEAKGVCKDSVVFCSLCLPPRQKGESLCNIFLEIISPGKCFINE